MSKLLAMMMKPKNYMYATIKGSLTENNGVFSGFSSSDYLTLQQPFKLNANTVAEFKFKINISQIGSPIGIFATLGSYGISFLIGSNGKLRLYIGNNSTWNILNNIEVSEELSINTDYWLKLLINKGYISVLISTDGITYTTTYNTNKTISETYTYNLSIGVGRQSTQYFNGSIDLNQSYIKIANTKYQLQAVVGYTVVGSPTITDGVVSGFSVSDYLRTSIITLGTKNFEIKTSFVANSLKSTRLITTYAGADIFNGFFIRNNGEMLFRIYDDTITYNVLSDIQYQINTKYYVIAYRKENKIGIKVSTDNVNWIENTVDIPEETIITNSSEIDIGVNRYGATFLDGSIDLNETYIKINNKLWFNGQPA